MGDGSAVDMQGLAGEGEMGFTERLVLRRVGMDEAGDVAGIGLPARDQLRFTDQLTSPRADDVDTDDRAVDPPDELHEPGGLEDLRLAVAAEVVRQRLDLAVLLAR